MYVIIDGILGSVKHNISSPHLLPEFSACSTFNIPTSLTIRNFELNQLKSEFQASTPPPFQLVAILVFRFLSLKTLVISSPTYLSFIRYICSISISCKIHSESTYLSLSLLPPLPLFMDCRIASYCLSGLSIGARVILLPLCSKFFRTFVSQ